MRWKGWVIVLTMLLWPFYPAALTRDDFLIRTTQDVITLCTASESEPLYQAAIGFCHGDAAGAYQYYQATTAGAEQATLVCLPEPPPTRAEAIQMFVAWAKAHPQYLNERPVDSLCRFLGTTFACRQ
jgi:Ssp1 endopeptidase immunity protein Rap1a